MKQITTVMLALMMSVVVRAQEVYTTLSHSTTKQTGLSLMYEFKSGFTIGAKGSYLLSTYTGETGGKFQELANTAIGQTYDEWPAMYQQYFYKGFTEDRGTIQLLMGKRLGKLSLLTHVGISFRSQYWAAKDGNSPVFGADPDHRYFFTFKHIPPVALVGLSASYQLLGRWGISAGYNNIEHFVGGIIYKITPTKMNQW